MTTGTVGLHGRICMREEPVSQVLFLLTVESLACRAYLDTNVGPMDDRCPGPSHAVFNPFFQKECARMSCPTTDPRLSSRLIHFFGRPHLRLRVTFGHFWRLKMVALLTSLYVLGCWGGLVPAAYAASLAQHVPTRQL